MDPDEFRDWVIKEAIAQGLPPTVEDPAVLAKVAAIFRLAAPSKPVKSARKKTGKRICKPPTSATD